jgi:hypothetical protein
VRFKQRLIDIDKSKFFTFYKFFEDVSFLEHMHSKFEKVITSTNFFAIAELYADFIIDEMGFNE